jgi:hypothetical protein
MQGLSAQFCAQVAKGWQAVPQVKSSVWQFANAH